MRNVCKPTGDQARKSERRKTGCIYVGAAPRSGILAFFFLLIFPALSHGADGNVLYRDILGLDSRTIVWIVAELHLMFAAFVLGVPIFAVIVELVGKRTGDERYDKLAKEFTTLLTAAFSTTAALGGLLAFLLIGLYPSFMVHLGSVMHETFYVYASLFFAEAFTLYLYYYSWKRMSSTEGRAPRFRRIFRMATGLVGILILGVIFFGGENVSRIKAHGEEVAAQIGQVAESLTPILSEIADDDATLVAAVEEAKEKALAATGRKALEHELSVLAEATKGAAYELDAVERKNIIGAARSEASAAVEEAATIVVGVAEVALRESDAENVLGDFTRRIEEKVAEGKLDAFNRASNLSGRRWGGILLLSILFLVLLGISSYFASPKSFHLYLGLMLNIFGLALMMIANSWATYMMSPSGINEVTFEFGGTTWGAVNNVLWNPVNIHRFIANIVFGGFVAAAYAGVKFLGASTDHERAHYDWMGYVGNFVGMAAMLPLPFAGYYLGREIYSFSPIMGNNMMGGAFSWTFILQALLIGMLFMSANYYLWVGMQRIEGAERYRKFIPWNTVILIFSFAVWLTPHNLPLSGAERALMGGVQYHPVLKYFGLMPAKNAVVNFIILSTFFSFLMYRRANKGEVKPFTSHGMAAKGVVGAVAAICISLLVWYVSVINSVDLRELSIPVENRWVLDWTSYALILQALVIALVVGLTFRNRGVMGQFIFFGSTAILVTGFLGVWGFVTMVDANAFLRNIAVCQVLMVLTCLILNTTIDIFLFKGAPVIGKINWGNIPTRGQYALVLCCVSVVLLMGLMGFIRSGLREDWHIFGVLRDTSLGAGTPSNAYMTWVVGGIVLVFFALIAFVFWLSALGEEKTSAAKASLGRAGEMARIS